MSYPKEYPKKTYPVLATRTSSLMTRVEPLITPELLISRYLHGIDLSDYSTDEVKQEIMLAMNETELLTGLVLTRTQFTQRFPYDYSDYRNFIHLLTDHKPILQINRMAVESSNGQEIYRLPAEWIEPGQFHLGQLNLLPILTVFGTSGTIANGSPDGALVFLQSMTNYKWLPAFWTVEYESGVCQEDGKVPVIINDIIGITAATEILSTKQNLIRYNSQSLGQDGISQSSSGPGNQSYQPRIDNLNQRRERMIQKIKALYSTKYNFSKL